MYYYSNTTVATRIIQCRIPLNAAHFFQQREIDKTWLASSKG